jgi:NADP-dependent 3-hydroxy acid dehydrogenase YdfG
MDTASQRAYIAEQPFKIALITGASQGIGQALTASLAAEGYSLAVCARNRGKLDVLTQQLQEQYPSQRFQAFTCDVREASQVEKTVSQVLSIWERLDVLINNAGIAIRSCLLQEHSIEQIDDLINTNLKGSIYTMHAVLPAMVRQQNGTIININSTAGKTAFPYWSVYNASKFGLDALTKAVAQEQRDNGIRVASIYPGAVDTAIWDSAQLYAETRQNDMLQPQAVADAVLYLLNQPSGVWVSDITLEPLSSTL